MAEIAAKDIDYIEVSDIEYQRDDLSYTVPTVEEIYEKYPVEGMINFIIGTDAFIKIETWHQSDKLKDLLNFILFIREDNFDETPYQLLKEKGYNYILMQMPFCDISASEVREKIRQNKDICDIVPLKVAEYIRDNNVYKI